MVNMLVTYSCESGITEDRMEKYQGKNPRIRTRKWLLGYPSCNVLVGSWWVSHFTEIADAKKDVVFF